jgi:dUTP pyrophosphatase
MISIQIVQSQPTQIPTPASSGAAGMDIRAALQTPVTIEAGRVAMIPTGIAIALPVGYEAQIRSRSGLAANFGVFCLNSPGTIDSDFRGEIHVILANFGAEPFTVQHGDRIAQMVVARYETVQWEFVTSLNQTERGAGGFGSTGR